MDCETGGLEGDVSLLTAYFAILNKNLELTDELDLKLIPDDGIYKVTGQALSINKIDLTKLAQEAITYKEAKTQLYNFLNFNYNGEQLIPIGQNINFDVAFIKGVIISKGSWESFVSHRPLDTMYIATYLKALGKLPAEQSVSLSNLVEYFNIVLPEGEAHEARYDTIATVEVLRQLLEIGNGLPPKENS